MTSSGKLEIFLEKAVTFRLILLILLPIGIYLDRFVVYRPFVPVYILLMVVVGFAFWHFGFQFIFSGMVTMIHFYLSPYGFSEWQVIIFQWGTYTLISFVTTLLIKRYLTERKNVLRLTQILARTLDSRDPYTANHSENVARYSLMIAEELGLSQKEQEHIYIGGLLHDLGKIGIPEGILSKPTRLTDEEFEKIKTHPKIGFNILKLFPFFRENGILDMVLYHHERVDGKGYPEGLMGNEIPLVAKIIAVADSFDAMTSNRAYRKGKDIDFAINEIKKNRGIQFDEEIADAFLNILEKQGAAILFEENKQKKQTFVYHDAYIDY